MQLGLQATAPSSTQQGMAFVVGEENREEAGLTNLPFKKLVAGQSRIFGRETPSSAWGKLPESSLTLVSEI